MWDDWKTAGSYANEEESQHAFYAIVSKLTDYFRIYREVELWYYSGQPFQSNAQGRIDFVLTPTSKAIAEGWSAGIIGVECKKSGHKSAPAICQMLDYTRSILRLPGNIYACMEAVYLWPNFVASSHPFMASFMPNNRIGVVHYEHKKWYDDEPCQRLSFFSGLNQGMFYIHPDDRVTVRKFNPRAAGSKSGSR